MYKEYLKFLNRSYLYNLVWYNLHFYLFDIMKIILVIQILLWNRGKIMRLPADLAWFNYQEYQDIIEF
jgi:hypothetical protein